MSLPVVRCFPGKQSSWARVRSRAGTSLRRLSSGHMSSPSTGATKVSKGRQETTVDCDLLVKPKSKKKIHRQWQQGQISWEYCKEVGRLCRDGVRKAKACLELNLARDAKNNKVR